jgi:hypothetical protein
MSGMSVMTESERGTGGVRIEARNARTSGRRSPPPQTGVARQFLCYGWGIVVHPRRTVDVLAQEHSIQWAVAVVSLGVLQVWGNMLLFAAFGYSWLGSRPLLADPTYVGGFGTCVSQPTPGCRSSLPTCRPMPCSRWSSCPAPRRC